MRLDPKYTFATVGDQEPWETLSIVLPATLALFNADDREAVFVGSAFIISDDGHFVTARHVAAELRDVERQTYGEAKPSALLMESDIGGGLMRIVELNMSPDDNINSDLATGRVRLPMTAGKARLRRFELSHEPVTAGESVAAFGHGFDVGQVFATDSLFDMSGGFRMHLETVVQVFEKRPNIPAPCFQMEFEMPGGMSGGPILRDRTGEVVGVCAYGLGGDSEHEPYCYGSMLAPLWEPFGPSQSGWLPSH